MQTQKNIFKILSGFLVPVILILIISINWWGCKTENVVSPPSPIPVSQIANEIANANTSEKAVIAINHIIEKVGMGISIQGSDYNDYNLTIDIINKLTYSQINYSNNINLISMGAYYDSISMVPQEVLGFSVNKSLSFSRLKDKGVLASSNPENPNSAIILLIYAINGIIPSSIDLIDSLTIKSPIQNFLFGIWAYNEFEIENGNDNLLCYRPKACKIVRHIMYSACFNSGLGFDCNSLAQAAYETCCHVQGSGGH